MGGDEEVAALYEAQREALKGLAEAQRKAAKAGQVRHDFPGLENDPDCLKLIYESWDRWLESKQNSSD